MFGQPVAYTATLSVTGPSDTILDIYYGSGSAQLIAAGITGPTRTQMTGVFPAGVPVYGSDLWSFNNETTPNPPVPTSAASSLLLTFTPVPEPATAGVAAVAGVALLARRRVRPGRAAALVP